MNDRLEVEQFAALLEADAADRGADAAGHRSGDGATGPAPGARNGAAAGGAGGLVALAERVTVIGQIAELSVPGPSADFRDALRARLVAEAPALVAEGAGAGSRRARVRVPVQRVGRGTRTGARHSSDAKAGVLTGISSSWRRRLLAAGVGVAVATGSVGGIALASAGAEPGDPLYSAKKIFESLQLSLSGSPTDQGRDYLHLADIRLGEIDALLNRPDVDLAGSPTQAYLNQTLGELRTMIQDGGNLLVTQVQQHDDQTALHALADFLLTERQRVADLSWRVPPDLQSQPAQIVTLMDNLSSELQVAAQQAAAKQTEAGAGVQQGGAGQQGVSGGGTGTQTGAANPKSSATAEASNSGSSTAGSTATGTASSTAKTSSSASASASASSGATIGISVPVPVLPTIGVTVPSILGLPEIVVDLGGDGDSSSSATPTG